MDQQETLHTPIVDVTNVTTSKKVDKLICFILVPTLNKIQT